MDIKKIIAHCTGKNMSAKTNKIIAGYVEGEDCYYCGNCKNFISPNSCNIVNGIISFHGCCNFWKTKKVKK